jgi:hypothetical protein
VEAEEGREHLKHHEIYLKQVGVVVVAEVIMVRGRQDKRVSKTQLMGMV